MLSFNSFATQRVAILDTGLDLSDSRFAGHICSGGHKDYTGDGIYDNDGHGTHVAGLIVQYAKDADYCLVIYKYYKLADRRENSNNYTRYMKALLDISNAGDINIVNYSGGGDLPSIAEEMTMKKHSEITYVVSAGNSSRNLDDPQISYYPAKYRLDNIRVVGSKRFNRISSFSNYGSYVTDWEDGENVSSYAIGRGNTNLSGTSMSTAIRTGKLIYERYKHK